MIDPALVPIEENDQRAKLRRFTGFAGVDVYFRNFGSYLKATEGRLHALKAS